jgi:hypothetical protein
LVKEGERREKREREEREREKEREMHAWLQQPGKRYDRTFLLAWGTAAVVV